MRTVTFDPAVYKLVLVAETPEWRANLTEIGYSHKTVIKDVLQSVPDQLPGVVEHSGEPVAWWIKGKGGFYLSEESITPSDRKLGFTEIFTHPAPSQPSVAKYTPPTEAECDEFRRMPGSFNDMVRAIHEHGYHTYAGAANVHFGEFYKAKFDAAIASQPSAEALVQAALEAAAEWLLNNYQAYPTLDSISNAIRALSAQQIIEEAGK